MRPEWHPDPWQRFDHRYWDGQRWTEHVSTGGQTATDPPEPGERPAPSPSSETTATPSTTTTAVAAPRTNGLAVTALVLGILSIFTAVILIGGLGGILAVVLGFVARGQVRKDPARQTGSGLAVGGIVCGFVAIAIALLVGLGIAALVQVPGFEEELRDEIEREMEELPDP